VTCYHVGNAIVSISDGPYRCGKVFFELHSFFGPCPIRKDGKPRNLPERHPFWSDVLQTSEYLEWHRRTEAEPSKEGALTEPAKPPEFRDTTSGQYPGKKAEPSKEGEK
jgi:hypothetical protein